MHFLYNFGIRLYGLAIWIASHFSIKAKKWLDGRRDYFDLIPAINHSNVLWFHCASLGEFDMGLPVMNELKSRNSDLFILVSFFSPSGMEHYMKRKHCVDLAVYLPLDTPQNAKKFINHFGPRQAFFVKYEFWSNHILEAKKQGVQLFSICTALRPDHRFFKWYGSFFRKTLRAIDFFYTQNETSTLLLADLKISQCLLTGDTRFDKVLDNKSNLQRNDRIESFLKGEKAFIIGSSWPMDEKVVFDYIHKNPTRKFIVAPHQIDEEQLKKIEIELNGRCQRYTRPLEQDKHVLILDTIGHLASAYSYGEIAFVGGGFSGKLHNILEPAVFGLPVIFGPRFKKFPEATQFIHKGIGFAINDSKELELCIQEILSNYTELHKKTSEFVIQNKGAKDKIVNHLIEMFPI